MVLSNFDTLLKKYAQLITEIGVNVQKSHTVVVQIQVEQAPLARYIVKEAYKLGAKQVIVNGLTILLVAKHSSMLMTVF